LISDKEPKTYLGEKIAFSTSATGKTGYLSACKRLKINSYFLLCTKLNSKWSKDLHVRPYTLKL
jgi:phage FluMu gp28-like protein